MVQVNFGGFTSSVQLVLIQGWLCVSVSWGRRKGGSDGIRVLLCNREYSTCETESHMVPLRGGGPDKLLEVVGLQEEIEGGTIDWLQWWAPTLDCQDPLLNKGLDLSKPQLPYL